MPNPKIGFIGQGFIGENMADDFVNRGFEVVRYALEPAYAANQSAVAECPIVFIAVPTPTTPAGFDDSIIEAVLSKIGKGATAVIKSTVLPGTTEKMQSKFPDIFVMHSPEFLREKTAAEDSARPERTVIGIAKDTPEFRAKADEVRQVLPDSPYNLITTARTAECIKYIGNTFLYTKLVFMNIAHDFVASAGADWEQVRQAVGEDSRIGSSHTQPVNDDGRGAGGHCFIKDFEAFSDFYGSFANDPAGLAALHSLRNKNNELLLATHKDIDLLEGVFGKDIPTTG